MLNKPDKQSEPTGPCWGGLRISITKPPPWADEEGCFSSHQWLVHLSPVAQLPCQHGGFGGSRGELPNSACILQGRASSSPKLWVPLSAWGGMCSVPLDRLMETRMLKDFPGGLGESPGVYWYNREFWHIPFDLSRKFDRAWSGHLFWLTCWAVCCGGAGGNDGTSNSYVLRKVQRAGRWRTMDVRLMRTVLAMWTTLGKMGQFELWRQRSGAWYLCDRVSKRNWWAGLWLHLLILEGGGDVIHPMGNKLSGLFTESVCAWVTYTWVTLAAKTWKPGFQKERKNLLRALSTWGHTMKVFS